MINLYPKKKAIVVRGPNAKEEAEKIIEQYGGRITENHKTTGYTIRFSDESFDKYVEGISKTRNIDDEEER